MNVDQFQEWPNNNPEIPMSETLGKKYFVRIVWSGEPHINPEDSVILKETLGIFVTGQHSPVGAINTVASDIVAAGAYVTEMHYVAAMDITEPEVEAQIVNIEKKTLVEKVDEAYVLRAIENSDARITFARRAAQYQKEAKDQVKH